METKKELEQFDTPAAMLLFLLGKYDLNIKMGTMVKFAFISGLLQGLKMLNPKIKP